jgi:hypothetical protein
MFCRLVVFPLWPGTVVHDAGVDPTTTKVDGGHGLAGKPLHGRFVGGGALHDLTDLTGLRQGIEMWSRWDSAAISTKPTPMLNTR